MWYIDINIFDIDISIFHPISILLISFNIFSITSITLSRKNSGKVFIYGLLILADCYILLVVTTRLWIPMWWTRMVPWQESLALSGEEKNRCKCYGSFHQYCTKLNEHRERMWPAIHLSRNTQTFAKNETYIVGYFVRRNLQHFAPGSAFAPKVKGFRSSFFAALMKHENHAFVAWNMKSIIVSVSYFLVCFLKTLA